MSVERIIHVVAGFFIMLSVVLSGAPLNEPTWLWFTLFVGANLFQSGITQWCMMGIILKKLGLKSESACKTC